MRTLLSVALGVIAAIGGFVAIGDLVFNAQAGASVGTPALWAVPVGVLGTMLFAEMSGRIVAVSKKPNFVLVKERYGPRLSTFTLAASLVLTVLTLGAELGGLGFVLNYLRREGELLRARRPTRGGGRDLLPALRRVGAGLRLWPRR